MKEAIEQRESFEAWERNKVAEWKTASLAMVIANLAEDKKHREALVKMAQDISLTKPATDTKSQLNKPKSVKLKSGEEISIEDFRNGNYSDADVDRSQEDNAARARARAKNRALNPSALDSMLTRK